MIGAVLFHKILSSLNEPTGLAMSFLFQLSTAMIQFPVGSVFPLPLGIQSIGTKDAALYPSVGWIWRHKPSPDRELHWFIFISSQNAVSQEYSQQKLMSMCPKTVYKYIHGTIIGDSPKLEMCQVSVSSLMGELWYIHPLGCYTAETEHIKVTSNNMFSLWDMMWNQRNQTQKECSTAGVHYISFKSRQNWSLVFEVTCGRWQRGHERFFRGISHISFLDLGWWFPECVHSIQIHWTVYLLCLPLCLLCYTPAKISRK